MTRLSNMRSEAFSRQVSTIEDVPNLRIGHSAAVLVCQNTLNGLAHEAFFFFFNFKLF